VATEDLDARAATGWRRRSVAAPSGGPGAAPLASALCALALFLAAEAAAQGRAIEVYRPSHRPAAELVGVAQTALGESGVVTVDAGTNALVLAGPRSRVDEALALVRQLDRARPRVVVHFSHRSADTLEASGIQVEWRAESGPLRVGRAAGPGLGEGLRVRAGATASRSSGELSGVVRVLDGEEAEIGTGRSAPVVRGLGVAIREARRGLRVRPRIQGDGSVRLEVEPVDESLAPRGSTAFTRGATTVVVEPGETVALGGISSSDVGRSVGTSGVGSRSASGENVWLLRVEVEGAGPEPGASPSSSPPAP